MILKKYKILFMLIILILLIISLNINSKIISVLMTDHQIDNILTQLFNDRNQVYLKGNIEELIYFYDTDIKYGKWAYEYGERKLKYIQEWSKKQGVEFTAINSSVKFNKVTQSEYGFHLNAHVVTEYHYKYINQKSDENVFKIATFHIITINNNKEHWVFAKEWVSDPMCDTLNLSDEQSTKNRDFIVTQTKSSKEISQNRQSAIDYAHQYCGAHGEYKYNYKYRNYNPVGGDCANFVSQVLNEGGKFRETSTWCYDKGGSRAWIKAEDLTFAFLYGGRASKIAVGKYEDVYQSSFKLLPGDLVAYEEKGEIKHVSVVTGTDYKGYPLVDCHNIDRYLVPWDIGWNRRNVRFWLIHIHY